MLWTLGVVAAALLVGGTVAAVVLPGSSTGSSAGSAPGRGSTGAATAGTASGGTASGGPTSAGPGARDAAALLDWTRAELPPGAQLVGSPQVVTALRRAGAPQDTVVPAGGAPASGSGGPVLTVTDGSVPPGARLVARFGTPARLAVVDPTPGQPSAEELSRRRDLAAAMLANPMTRTGDTATATLRAAAVDPRLLSMLAALAADSGVGIADLPAVPGEPPDGPLARSALIDEVGGQPVRSGAEPATTNLVTYLRAQLPPYRPDDVTVTPSGVLVVYRYLSAPDAVVSAASH